MRLLVIGGGGREHALIWKLSASPRVEKIFAVPGNGGMSELADCYPSVPIDGDLVKWAGKHSVDLVVIGPEAPLVAGLADQFEAARIAVFGPSSRAAKLEGSKVYAKEIMRAAGVPTAAADVFSSYEEAIAGIRAWKAPYVIKADGLAAGKGVIIAEDEASAEQALRECLVEQRFGSAGQTVLVEEFLSGPEVSILAFVDGETVRIMPASQDYKRVGEGDTGPNTGGMGAYTPVPFMDENRCERVVADIIRPTIQTLAQRGIDYKGVLYVGLMMTDDGLKVLEFNVRFGDPETQALMMLLESDLAQVMWACARGELADVDIVWAPKKCVSVVMASEGYPRSPVVGREIKGLSAAAQTDVEIFHAGTKQEDGRVVTSGGRVLNVSAVGDSFAEARDRVYEALKYIDIQGG
ncbi:MAG TPA: phosphoribosylamine--glycine ligase, partial [Actinobacteria bacterium]|nr:phosphoribosylamine--glycine ligase [Actinomycetota bacterium]